MIKKYGGGWFSFSNPDPEERQPPPPPPKKISRGATRLTTEHKDRFAALRRTVDHAQGENK